MVLCTMGRTGGGRTTDKEYDLFKEPDIIKIGRLRWAGHVMRTEDEEISQITNNKKQ